MYQDFRKFLAAFALLTLFAGCASFEPPQYGGQVSKIEEPIELASVISGKFDLTERSLTTTSTVVSISRGFSMVGTAKVRSETSAHSKISPAGNGYVMTVTFDSISAEPVSGLKNPDEHRFKVRDLGYTGFLDGDGKVVAFDVDVMSEGWLSLEPEIKQSVQDELDGWKKRRKRRPVLPNRVVPGDVIEIDVSDIYSGNSDKLPADFESLGGASYRFAGTTTYRERSHLVLVIQGKIAGASKEEKMQMTGELGGFALIDIANGDPSHWEHSVRVKVAVPSATITIREESEGDLTRQ